MTWWKRVKLVRGQVSLATKRQRRRETNDKKDIFRVLALFIEHGRLGNCRHCLPQPGRSKVNTKMRLPHAKQTSRKLSQVWQYNGSKISWNPNEKVFSNVQHFKCVILLTSYKSPTMRFSLTSIPAGQPLLSMASRPATTATSRLVPRHNQGKLPKSFSVRSFTSS